MVPLGAGHPHPLHHQPLPGPALLGGACPRCLLPVRSPLHLPPPPPPWPSPCLLLQPPPPRHRPRGLRILRCVGSVRAGLCSHLLLAFCPVTIVCLSQFFESCHSFIPFLSLSIIHLDYPPLSSITHQSIVLQAGFPALPLPGRHPTLSLPGPPPLLLPSRSGLTHTNKTSHSHHAIWNLMLLRGSMIAHFFDSDNFTVILL